MGAKTAETFANSSAKLLKISPTSASITTLSYINLVIHSLLKKYKLLYYVFILYISEDYQSNTQLKSHLRQPL